MPGTESNSGIHDLYLNIQLTVSYIRKPVELMVKLTGRIDGQIDNPLNALPHETWCEAPCETWCEAPCLGLTTGERQRGYFQRYVPQGGLHPIRQLITLCA